MSTLQPNRNSSTAEVPSPPLLLRMASVVRMTGLGRSTIYRMMAENSFPRPVQLTRRLIAWRRADLEQWSEARPLVTH